jgi:hypothetical protein
MDKLTGYREILRRVLGEYAAWSGGGGITAEVVEDPTRDHFELLRFGWDGHRYVHGAILHADLIDGKIWIQYDGTNRPLAEELVSAGVSKDDIVLGYKSPRVRPITGYAVG